MSVHMPAALLLCMRVQAGLARRLETSVPWAAIPCTVRRLLLLLLLIVALI
jgi:hypothetical protein